MTATDFRKWLAIGTAVGIEIGREDLIVNMVRVRPSGATVLGELMIPHFREQAAAEWGATYSRFLRKLGFGHLAATALLPRAELTVRQVSLPGVSDKDLAAAIQFEIDSLNPYSDEDVAYDWARIGQTVSILVGITQRSTLDYYTTLFSEAGIKIASFTFSAAVLYSAARVVSGPSRDGFVALHAIDDEVEVYGESPAKALFSARLDQPAERVRTLAIAELRLPPETEPAALPDALLRPLATPADYDAARACLAYATALSTGSLRPALRLNLLPAERRQQTSRIRFIPSIALSAIALLLMAAVLTYPKYADRRYLGLLEAQIRKLEPQARKAVELDGQIASARSRADTLDRFRKHTGEDLDTIQELAKILPPSVWVGSLQLTRDSVTIAGEADQAAGLLKVLDNSHQVHNSAFTVPLTRVASGEIYSIRSQRKAVTP
jgi:hypothetical protein